MNYFYRKNWIISANFIEMAKRIRNSIDITKAYDRLSNKMQYIFHNNFTTATVPVKMAEITKITPFFLNFFSMGNDFRPPRPGLRGP